MKTIFRVANTADAEALSRLGRETFADTFGHLYPPQDLAAFLEQDHAPAVWTAHLSNPAVRTFVAEHEGELVAYALAGPCKLPHPDVSANAGELKRLYVARSQQGTGAGGALLDEAFRWLLAQGKAPIWIGVWSENHRALKIYESRGFNRVGEYLFVVGNTRDLEFILRCDDAAGPLLKSKHSCIQN